MKISKNLLLMAAIGWMACTAQAGIAHRYTFVDSANDSEGEDNGTVTAVGTHTVAP